MTEAPLVSVVMPVFNGAPYVEAAILSVLAQSGPIEILLHDDGSTDETRALVERLAADEPRLRVSGSSNAGPASARNHCLARARGELIAFLDHDDIWPSGRLRRQANLLESNPSVGAVIGHTLMFEALDARGEPCAGARSRRVLAGLLQAGLFRRSALPAGGFDTSFAAADDLDFLLRMLEGVWTVEIDTEVAVYYRLHPTQWTADTRFATRQTVRALHRSLQRRRRNGVAAPLSRAR